MSNIVFGRKKDPSADIIAGRAKRQLEKAQKAVIDARRQLHEAMKLHSRATKNFVDADLRRDCPWNNMYRKLLEYKEEHGDILVLTTKESSVDTKKLGKWVQNQRVHYKYFMNGEKKIMKEHRIDALNRIGFVWNVLEHAWDANFHALYSYYEKHGNFDVPRGHSVKLCSFVTNLRKAMRRKNEGLLQKELTEERISRLNSINFVWKIKHPARLRPIEENIQFDYLYDLLADFKETYGHVQVSKMMPIWRSSEEKPAKAEYKRLPFFIARVRSEHESFVEGKPSALNEAKVRKLTELGVKWKRPASAARKSCGKQRTREDKEIGDDSNISADAVEGELINDDIKVVV